MNLVENALKNGELHKLLSGQNGYFIEDKDFPNEPTDYYIVWQQHILPYIVNNPNEIPTFNREINQALNLLLNQRSDENLGIYSFFSNMTIFYMFNMKQKISGINMSFDTAKICKVLSLQKEELIKNKKWSGAEWNAANRGLGLWGSLQSCSESIRKNGGSDFSSCL